MPNKKKVVSYEDKLVKLYGRVYSKWEKKGISVQEIIINTTAEMLLKAAADYTSEKVDITGFVGIARGLVAGLDSVLVSEETEPMKDNNMYM